VHLGVGVIVASSVEQQSSNDGGVGRAASNILTRWCFHKNQYLGGDFVVKGSPHASCNLRNRGEEVSDSFGHGYTDNRDADTHIVLRAKMHLEHALPGPGAIVDSHRCWFVRIRATQSSCLDRTYRYAVWSTKDDHHQWCAIDCVTSSSGGWSVSSDKA